MSSIGYGVDLTPSNATRSRVYPCAPSVRLGSVRISGQPAGKRSSSWTWFQNAALALVVLLLFSATGLGQDSESSDDLLRGLLELTEPQPTGSKQTRERPNVDNIGFLGTPSEHTSQHPLVPMQLAMDQAAAYLRRGSTGDATQQIQQTIVDRLRELVEQSQQTSRDSAKTQPQNGNGSDDASEREPNTAPEPTGDAPQNEQNDSPKPSTSTGPGTEGEPGGQPEAAAQTLAQGNAQDLQRGVWGNLPQRVRQQMQTRMVEQFLPSYREQIEIYYRTLLEQRAKHR